MPDQTQAARQVVALALAISAITLVVLAVLAYTGTLPLPEEMRFVVTLVLAGAAFIDFAIGLWFFRKGLSS